MSLKEEAEFLAQVPLFREIEPARLKLVAFASQRLTYAAGQELFHQGDMADAVYIVIEGEAAVLVDRPGGSIEVSRIHRHDVMGEVAVLCQIPRTATIRAETNLVVLRLAQDVFLRILRDFPSIAMAVMQVLARRLEHTTSQLRTALAAQPHTP